MKSSLFTIPPQAFMLLWYFDRRGYKWYCSTVISRLSVMDENRLSSNAFIGETCVPLKSLVNRPVQRFKRLLEEQSDVSHHMIFPLIEIMWFVDMINDDASK